MHPAPCTPLGQALAAIIQLLIAAIAEHAREHPLLAPGCRASIRQLEKLIRRFDAMVAEWQAAQAESRTPGVAPKRPSPPKQTIRSETERRREEPSLRLCVSMWNRVPSARAPPGLHPRAPPTPAAHPAPARTPPEHPPGGAAAMYAEA